MTLSRAASLRSANSETSSAGDATERLRKRHGLGTNQDGDGEEEEDLLEQNKTLQEAVFSAMYCLSRSRTADSWRWATLKLVLEGLVPFLVVFNPHHWPLDTGNPVWQVVRAARTIGISTATATATATNPPALPAAAATPPSPCTKAQLPAPDTGPARNKNISLSNHTYVYCPPSEQGYRTYVNIFYALVCLIYSVVISIGVLTLAMRRQLLQKFTDALFNMAYVAVFDYIMFLFNCRFGSPGHPHNYWSDLVASCDLSPVATGITASPAAVTRLQVLVLKALFVVAADTLVAVGKPQAVVMLVLALGICWLNFRALPFLRLYVNDIWVAVWVAVSYLCTIHVVMDLRNDKEAGLMTRVVLYGTFPALVTGAVVTAVWSRWRLRPAAAYRGLDIVTARQRKLNKFSSPADVEVVARVMRHFDSEGVILEEAAQLGETIIKCGMAVFPGHVGLLILYANFLMEPGSALPDFQHHREQQAAQGRAVIRVHKASLAAQREVWQLMQHPAVKAAAMDAALRALDATAEAAHRVYRRVLERYPHNGKLLRCYGKFLEDVRHDPVSAARAYADAARNGGGDGLLSLDLKITGSDKPEFLASMDLHDDACIVINAEGKILMVNACVTDLLGYPRSELEGSNVSMIMPQPFSSRHTGYISRYVQGGEPHILDTVRDVVALHKDRYVFPLQLCVTKLSGVGTDAIFLGLLRPQPLDSRNMRAWVAPNGVILCTDPQFSSLTGLLGEEMVGRNFRTLCTDIAAVDAMLESCRTAPYEQLVAGEISFNLEMAHRYLPPMPVRITVKPGGTDSQRIFVMNAQRVCNADTGFGGGGSSESASAPFFSSSSSSSSCSEGLIVVDARGGLVFATWDVAAMLGYPMRSFLRLRLEQLLPEPFATLHVGKYLREAPATIPPVSCRAGRLVHLVNSNGAQVNKVDTNNDIALHADRRLVLTCSMDGSIVFVDQPSSALFGFSASACVGSNLADCIDVFSEWRTKAGAHQTELLLLSLLDKEAEMPGTSWRVKVHSPETAEDGELRNLPPSGNVDAKVPTRRPVGRSACLQTELVETVQDERNRGSGGGGGFNGGGGGGGGAQASGSHAGSFTEAVGAAVKSGAVVNSSGGGGTQKILARIILWRRDILTGTVELDEQLVVRKADISTGLIVGLPPSSLPKMPLSRSHKPSALKGSTTAVVSEPKAFIGPHPDGGTMRIILQGVSSLGSSSGRILVTLHPDTSYVGARANLYRALGLEAIIHNQQQQQSQQPGQQGRNPDERLPLQRPTPRAVLPRSDSVANPRVGPAAATSTTDPWGGGAAAPAVAGAAAPGAVAADAAKPSTLCDVAGLGAGGGVATQAGGGYSARDDSSGSQSPWS
ncbi:hypothetical protein VOLCADRAFT_93925 [Volvox carteri f. nagariensis]|uniref:PAS domain-containing protein n=1 Tax=Volvox carteri f. nagariensis TaxID=3068 RepID=D8U3F7_VOLCA|nr:uncharacterized protein VOLCADRAFT_93925 [Volvox carteri f. nagariensis]EFJ45817.1 hypothetical protein VOLCADRAFT_93925 [Volvox carteri f. nagariensis]|eukprot:XP_002953218.1 hypothetical protein VOLCADRAFT_93925 [Volvox carteri f. nagariensis]